MANNWTLTCDNMAAFIPISKNWRNILIILVTGSTEPSCHRNILSQKKHINNTRVSQKLGRDKILYHEIFNSERYDQIEELLRNTIYLFENNTLQRLSKENYQVSHIKR